VFDSGGAWVVSMGYGYVSICNKDGCKQVWPVMEQRKDACLISVLIVAGKMWLFSEMERLG